MKYNTYIELKNECKRVGIENDSTLNQLLHIVQTDNHATMAFAQYKQKINAWENNLVKEIRQHIKGAQEGAEG